MKRTPSMVVLLAGFLVCNLAAAQIATLHYVSEEGDFIGQGETHTYTEADGDFTAQRNPDNGVTINFDHATETAVWWTLSFAAPFSDELTPGFYPNAQRYPFQDADRPGLSFSGSGRGCNTLTGEFTVTDTIFDWYGVPRRFSAGLEQHCEGMTPALFATIDYDFGGIGPASFGNRNIVVLYENLVHEYRTDGTHVQTIPILGTDGDPTDAEDGRDLVLDEAGHLHLFNGTFDPVLSSFEPPTGSWVHNTFTGWGIFNNVSYGGIAAYGNYVFVTDQVSPSGIVRFVTTDYSGQRFADGSSPIDLTIGLDGRLYALLPDENTVEIYNPVTLASLGTVVLADNVRGIAVATDGDLFGASWDGSIYHFNSSGARQNSIAAGVGSLTDIDLADTGTIAVGARFNSVVVTTAALTSVSSFSLPGSPTEGTFVAFALDPLWVFDDGFESGDISLWSHALP